MAYEFNALAIELSGGQLRGVLTCPFDASFDSSEKNIFILSDSGSLRNGVSLHCLGYLHRLHCLAFSTKVISHMCQVSVNR